MSKQLASQAAQCVTPSTALTVIVPLAVTAVFVLSFPKPPSVVSPASLKLMFVIDFAGVRHDHEREPCTRGIRVASARSGRIKSNRIEINRVGTEYRRSKQRQRVTGRRIFSHIDVIDRRADVRPIIDGHGDVPADVPNKR